MVLCSWHVHLKHGDCTPNLCHPVRVQDRRELSAAWYISQSDAANPNRFVAFFLARSLSLSLSWFAVSPFKVVMTESMWSHYVLQVFLNSRNFQNLSKQLRSSRRRIQVVCQSLKLKEIANFLRIFLTCLKLQTTFQALWFWNDSKLPVRITFKECSLSWRNKPQISHTDRSWLRHEEVHSASSDFETETKLLQNHPTESGTNKQTIAAMEILENDFWLESCRVHLHLFKSIQKELSDSL